MSVYFLRFLFFSVFITPLLPFLFHFFFVLSVFSAPLAGQGSSRHHRSPRAPHRGPHSTKMPNLDVSELNIVLGVFGTFILLYGIISVKIKSKWFLGEACE